MHPVNEFSKSVGDEVTWFISRREGLSKAIRGLDFDDGHSILNDGVIVNHCVAPPVIDNACSGLVINTKSFGT
jgi:hypothetical protein